LESVCAGAGTEEAYGGAANTRDSEEIVAVEPLEAVGEATVKTFGKVLP
jgi:hypothetical protein